MAVWVILPKNNNNYKTNKMRLKLQTKGTCTDLFRNQTGLHKTDPSEMSTCRSPTFWFELPSSWCIGGTKYYLTSFFLYFFPHSFLFSLFLGLVFMLCLKGSNES